AADVDLKQFASGRRQALGGAAHGGGVGAKLLPKGDGDAVLQVGTADLDHVREGVGAFSEGFGQAFEACRRLLHYPQERDPEGGWDNVVGRLGHVDVDQGVDVAVVAPGPPG